MKENPLISVVIPCYNCAQTIRQAVDSVLAQTYQNFEIILVDDASTDGTPATLSGLLALDPCISVLTLEENSGGAAAPKNLGIQSAKGEYIAVLDADDLWHPDKLQKQLELFQNNPGLDWVGCAYRVIKAESANADPAPVTIPNKNHKTSILVKDYMGPGSCIMYKKSVFDGVGLFDPLFKNNQDWDMRIRLAVANKPVTFINEPLVDYLIHKQNVSHRSNKAIMLYLRKVTYKHWKTLLKHPLALIKHLLYLAVRHILYATGLIGLLHRTK